MRLALSFVAAVSLALLFALPSTRATADGVYAEGSTGYDVSWPQCEGGKPAPPFSFVVIGATGGRALTDNPCLEALRTWAVQSLGKEPTYYVNMKFPSGTTMPLGMTGPAGNCVEADLRCQATNYGHKTAEHAVAAVAAHGAPAMSWLDVETVSTWSEDPALNELVIRAAIDYYRTRALPVGVYSTPSQWKSIAGEYRPGLPVWSAGASSASAAAAYCRTGAFGGGPVVMVQYLLGGFDANYVCRPADYIAPTATPTAVATAVPTAAVTVTPTAPPTPSIAGTIPPGGGMGIAVFSGGHVQELVTASKCPIATAVFYFTVAGEFVVYIPGTSVGAVNAPFASSFPDGRIAAGTPFIGRCI